MSRQLSFRWKRSNLDQTLRPLPAYAYPRGYQISQQLILGVLTNPIPSPSPKSNPQSKRVESLQRDFDILCDSQNSIEHLGKQIAGLRLVNCQDCTQHTIRRMDQNSQFPITADFLLMFNLWQLLFGQWPRSDGALFPLCQVQLALCSSHLPQASASALRRGAGGRCSEIRASSSSQASLHKTLAHNQIDGDYLRTLY